MQGQVKKQFNEDPTWDLSPESNALILAAYESLCVAHTKMDSTDGLIGFAKTGLFETMMSDTLHRNEHL